jgi:HEAT repeat protein
MPTLLSATIDDPNEGVREYAGRALKSALPSIRDENVLHVGAITLAKTLQHKDTKRRQYAAVLLSWLVPRLTEVDTLRAISEHVSTAAQRDRNGNVREYAGRAARHIKQELANAVAEAVTDNDQ